MKQIVLLVASITAVVVLASFTDNNATELSEGRTLYEAHCVRCHGADGAKRKWGAHDLRKSHMDMAAITARIRTGKGIMPSFNNKLDASQIQRIAAYVRTLRDPITP